MSETPREKAERLLSRALQVQGVDRPFLVHGIDLEGMEERFARHQASVASSDKAQLAWIAAADFLRIVEARDEAARELAPKIRALVAEERWREIVEDSADLAQLELIGTGVGPWHRFHSFVMEMIAS